MEVKIVVSVVWVCTSVYFLGVPGHNTKLVHIYDGFICRLAKTAKTLEEWRQARLLSKHVIGIDYLELSCRNLLSSGASASEPRSRSPKSLSRNPSPIEKGIHSQLG